MSIVNFVDVCDVCHEEFSADTMHETDNGLVCDYCHDEEEGEE